MNINKLILNRTSVLLHTTDALQQTNDSRMFNSLKVKVAMGMLLAGIVVSANAVNLAEMRENIKGDLNGTVNGYSFVIKQGNVTHARSSGWAIRPVDVDGGQTMTWNTRSFIASVTKTFTAVATLQLLEANDLTIEENISDWLPDNWTKGVGIEDLTFKHLLTHTSGFKQIFNGLNEAKKDKWGNDWQGLKWIVKNGARPDSSRAYKNANFALLRVIIPKLWKASGMPDADFTAITRDNHGLLYVIYATNHIFNPSGIDVGASCSASQLFKPQAMGYDANDASEQGLMSERSWANCGGDAGLRLSARDLGKFMASLIDGTLLSPYSRLMMDHFRLGWRKNSNEAGDGREGKWWHDGVWNISNNRGYRACVMKYPDNVVAALVINSRTESKTACSILKDGYNDAL